jgi:hypothetical protein
MQICAPVVPPGQPHTISWPGVHTCVEVEPGSFAPPSPGSTTLDVLAPLQATNSAANAPSSGQRLVIRSRSYGEDLPDLPRVTPRAVPTSHSRTITTARTTEALAPSPRTPIATRAPDAGAALQVTSAPPVDARRVSPSRST